jgi:hypothetical protein
MTRLDDVGLRLSKPPAEFRRIRDIEFFEGPLITEFQVVPDGEPYLFIWRARDEEYNRWLAIRTTKRDIALYENRETTLRLMIERAVQAFLVDVDSAGIFRRWWSAVFEHLPGSYVPAGNSFYGPEFRPPADTERKRGLSILINGQWELKDIIEYSSRFRDVYSAEYLLSAEARTGPREYLFNYLLRGGIVYNTLFVGMSKAIPHEDQLALRTFQYSSPGIIEMDLNEDVAASVTRRVRALSHNIDEAREICIEVYRWHLAQDKETPPKKPVASNEQVLLMMNELTELMGFIDLGRLSKLTNDDLAQTAKIVLACFRRIDTLVRYQIDGKAKLVADLTEADIENEYPAKEYDDLELDDDNAFGFEPTVDEPPEDPEL